MAVGLAANSDLLVSEGVNEGNFHLKTSQALLCLRCPGCQLGYFGQVLRSWPHFVYVYVLGTVLQESQRHVCLSSCI
jgi:hypothetical protein